MKNLHIKIYKSFCNDLKKKWEDLEKVSETHIFQTYNWQKLWIQNQQDNKVKITNYTILVFNDQNLIMILPLNIKTYFCTNILNWSGFPFSDYNIPIISKYYSLSELNFKEIWKNILTNNYDFDCVILDNQPSRIFSKNNPFFSFLNNQIFTEYYGIILNKEFQINFNEEKNIIYQEKRLKKLGKLSFKIARSKNEKLKVIDFIIENKTKQYQDTKAWDLFKIKSNKDFFISSNANLDKNNYLTYLTFNNKIIAAHSGFIYKFIFYYLFPSYDVEFKKYSPGKILLKKLIEDCKYNDIKYFDLTIGSENYKKSFANNKLLSGKFMESVNFRGQIYLFFVKVNMISKNIIKQIIKNF